MNNVMKIIKDEALKIVSQDFELSCSLSFYVRKSNSNNVYDEMCKIIGLEIKYIKTI
jgi:hypothetical protein